MYASTGQVAAQERRTVRSQRFLIRLGILCAASAAAFLAGTAAAEADEQNATPDVVQGEPAANAQVPAEPNPVPDPQSGAGDDGGEPMPAKQPAPIELTGLAGNLAAATEIVSEAAELVEEVPTVGVPAPVVGTVAHAVREVAATGDTVLDGAEVGAPELVVNALDVTFQAVASGVLPTDGEGTEAPAPQAPAPQTPAPQIPGHQSSEEPFVPPVVGELEQPPRQVLPLPAEMSRPDSVRTSAGSGATDLRSEAAAAAPVEAPAALSSDLGGSNPLSELLGGDHGVVGGGGGVGVADRATPVSTCYGDRAGLVSDPVRTDARPHSEPVARPGFAPD